MNKIVVSVGIMHVPNSGRDEMVKDILAILPKEWSVVVVEDPERKGCWPTAQRAWATRTEESTHHLVLSDDAVLCDHFGELLLSAIDAKPDAVMSLCCWSRKIVDDAVLAKKSWIHSGDYAYGQALLLPCDLIEEMLDWNVENVKPNYKHDDGRVALWAKGTKRGIHTPVPQLVRHGESESLLGHRPAIGLGTALFASDRRDVNWNTDALEVKTSLFGNAGLKDSASDELKELFQQPERKIKRTFIEAPAGMAEVLKVLSSKDLTGLFQAKLKKPNFSKPK